MSKGYFSHRIAELVEEARREQATKTAQDSSVSAKNMLQDGGSPDRITNNTAEMRKIAAEIGATSDPLHLDQILSFWTADT